MGMIKRTIKYKEAEIMTIIQYDTVLYKTLVRPHVSVRGVRIIRKTRSFWKRFNVGSQKSLSTWKG